MGPFLVPVVWFEFKDDTLAIHLPLLHLLYNQKFIQTCWLRCSRLSSLPLQSKAWNKPFFRQQRVQSIKDIANNINDSSPAATKIFTDSTIITSSASFSKKRLFSVTQIPCSYIQIEPFLVKAPPTIRSDYITRIQ